MREAERELGKRMKKSRILKKANLTGYYSRTLPFSSVYYGFQPTGI